MTDARDKLHLTPERIQAYLDGVLLDEEVADVRQHVTFCSRCQADLDAWQLLFGELTELSELAPSEVVRQGVMDRVRSGADTHLLGEEYHEYLDGLLGGRQAARVRAHLEDCADCRTEMAGWRRLIAALETVEPLEPSIGFAARVMHGWRERLASRQASDVAIEAALAGLGHHEPTPAFAARVMTGWRAGATEATTREAEVDRLLAGLDVFEPSPAFRQRVMGQLRIGRLVRPEHSPMAAFAGRAAAFARRWVPNTRRAWAIISGVAVTPATVVALVAWTVFSNPLATPSNLAAYAWWQVSGFASALMSGLSDAAINSAAMFQAYAAVEFLRTSPLIAAVGAVAFGLSTCLALWVLYKNLLPTRGVEPNYARVAA